MNSSMDFEQLVSICQRTHEELCVRAARVVDAHLVVRNWLFGHYIAEFEQAGADRAEYGARLLGRLADRLKPLKIKGTSITRLKLYRSFYRLFPIGSTLSDQLGQLLPKPSKTGPTPSDLLTTEGLQLRQTLSGALLKHFTLGWSHYVTLLRPARNASPSITIISASISSSTTACSAATSSSTLSATSSPIRISARCRCM